MTTEQSPLKRVTLNRVVIAIVLLYFPIATLGSTGSYWAMFKTFAFIVALMMVGAIEHSETIHARKVIEKKNSEERTRTPRSSILEEGEK